METTISKIWLLFSLLGLAAAVYNANSVITLKRQLAECQQQREGAVYYTPDERSKNPRLYKQGWLDGVMEGQILIYSQWCFAECKRRGVHGEEDCRRFATTAARNALLDWETAPISPPTKDKLYDDKDVHRWIDALKQGAPVNLVNYAPPAPGER